MSDHLSVVYWSRTHGFYYGDEPVRTVKYIRLEATDRRNPAQRLLESRRLNRDTYRLLVDKKPELIYVSGVECMPSAERYKDKYGASVILEIADIPAGSYVENRGLIGRKLENTVTKLVSQADGLVLTSPYFFSEYYRERLSIRESDVFCFENLPPKSAFANFQKNASDKLVIGFVGAIRYDDTLRTLFNAAKQEENLRVVVAGDGPVRGDLERETKGIDNVFFTGPYNYTEEIANIYSQIQLVYSVYNPKTVVERLALPNKLYEAIVCEIPILVAKGTCLEEYVKSLGVGISVEPNDVGKLRNLFLDLLSNPDILQKISQRESEIKERFLYENVEERFFKWISRFVR